MIPDAQNAQMPKIAKRQSFDGFFAKFSGKNIAKVGRKFRFLSKSGKLRTKSVHEAVVPNFQLYRMIRSSREGFSVSSGCRVEISVRQRGHEIAEKSRPLSQTYFLLVDFSSLKAHLNKTFLAEAVATRSFQFRQVLQANRTIVCLQTHLIRDLPTSILSILKNDI